MIDNQTLTEHQSMLIGYGYVNSYVVWISIMPAWTLFIPSDINIK